MNNVPPLVARQCLRFAKSLERLTSRRSFLLALSGGSDSTALACLSSLLGRKYAFFAVTINHGIRPEAESEVTGTVQLCERLGIPCTVCCLDVPSYARSQKMSLETAARLLRYRCLEEQRQRCACDYILTAHQASDRAEDILMRLCRGAGWPALGGMRACDENRHILRPLLDFSRAELQEILRLLGESWYTDDSNADCRYTRNRFRHTILPLFIRENPSFCQGMQRLAAQAAQDEAFWSDMLTKALNTHPWSCQLTPKAVSLTYSKALLAALPPAARMRLYRLALALVRSGQGDKQVRFVHLEQLEALVRRRVGGKTLQFPGGVTASFSGEGLSFVCLGS